MNSNEIFAKAGLPIPKKGVSYYNKDNKDNKDNRDNRDNEVGIPFSLGRTSSSEATPLDQEKEPLLDGVAKRAVIKQCEPLDSERGRVKAETPKMGLSNPAILPEDVDRCLLTFYDNGEQSRMRYKLGITINPNNAPGERWEFIANLNRDRRIFMKNIPEENKDFVVDFGNSMREICKKNFRNYPMLGKIHENSKISSSTNQKEDGCAAAVYWTGTEWLATVMLWEYIIKDIPLTDAFLTAKQKKDNVKGVSGVIYGPNSVSQANWQKRARPTFKSRKNTAV